MTDGRVRHGLPVAFGSGAIIGVGAGLIGVGGGEFRLPLLLYLFRGDVRIAAATNLVVGLFTVTLSFLRRIGQAMPSRESLILAGLMAGASVVGAVVGARSAHRIKSPRLLAVVIGYLLLVGVWMMIEAMLAIESPGLDLVGLVRVLLAVGLGFAIATVSAALGVAGGEMRIPALMFLFGFGIKEAGTLSLLASIPTVAGGALTYRGLGSLPGWAARVALVMGLGSLLGVWLGTAVLPRIDPHLLKGLLGAILLAATAVLIRSRRRGEAPLGK